MITRSARKTQRKRRPKKRTIRICRDGQGICFNLPPEDQMIVKNTIYTAVIRAVADAEHGFRVVQSYVDLSLLDIDGSDGFLRCPPGFLPIVEESLEKAGYDVDSSRATLKRLPRFSRDDQLDDIGLLEFVQNNERGLITHAPRKVDLGWLVRQIARAWPEKSVMVLCNRDNETALIQRQFGHTGATVATRRRQPERIKGVLVASASFAAGHTEVQKRDICIVVDATEMCSHRGVDAYSFLYRARLYGLVTEGATSSPYVRDQMIGAFGFGKLHIREHGTVFEPPVVCFVPYRGGVSVPPDQTSFSIKQRLIWENNGRNKFVAQLCRACTGQKEGLSDIPQQLVDDFAAKKAKVAVIVENVDHALALVRLLPQANIVTSESVCLDGLSHWAKERMEAAQSTKTPLSIVTMAGLNRMPRANVVIRADAGLSGMVEHSFNVERKCLLVDIGDRHHPLLRRWSKQRRAEYDAAGWKIACERAKSPLEWWDSTRRKDLLDARLRDVRR